MKVTKLLDNLYKIEADEGMVFATNDKTQVFGNELYVPSDSSAEYYIELSKEDAENLKVSLEEKYKSLDDE